VAIDASVALCFGEFLAKNAFRDAWVLLTPEAQRLYPPEEMKRQIEEMTAYAPGPILEVTLPPEGILEQWPDKRAGDMGRVYVALTGEGFNEAVTVLLTVYENVVKIGELDWGRP
jgi:hypothetical protein